MLNQARKNLGTQKGLIWSFFPLWAVSIALLWPGEEPGKLSTIIVVLLVFATAGIILSQAKRMGIIESATAWMFSFMIMMSLIPLVLQYSWVLPSSGHRALEGFDPVRYDYMGKMVAENNMDFSVVRGWVNYLGIVNYIAFIYWIFGVSTFYVSLWNLLFSLMAFLSVTGILVDRTGTVKPWQNMRWGLLLPSVLYFSAIPGKDILAMAFVAMSIFSISRLILVHNVQSYIILIIGLLGLSAVRGNATVLVLVVGFTFLLFQMKKKRFLPIFVLFGVISLLIVFVTPKIIALSGGTEFKIADFFDIEKKLEFSELVSGEGSLNKMFTPRNYIQLFLFVPIRTIFLLTAPSPKLWFYLGAGTKLEYSTLSLWIILLFSPALIAATIEKSCRKQEVHRFIIVPFWMLLAAISVAVFIIHERYRLMVIPFWLAAVLMGFYYGKPKRYITTSFGLISVGAVLYYLLKSFA